MVVLLQVACGGVINIPCNITLQAHASDHMRACMGIRLYTVDRNLFIFIDHMYK